MSTADIAVPRLLAAGLAAGVWVFVSGILMAAAFGYREMSVAFARIGLQIPMGAGPFVTHTLVRLGLGLAIVLLFVIIAQVFPRGQALLVAAGLAWVLASFFPFLVMTEWRLFPWSLAWKVWGWSAGEFLVAAWIGRLVYRGA
ncbi:MAG: hypothetical protein HY700_14115 [Gemmatimonadetes bacterium]|nr:hypothetical protein [Gemmatimonadota bacterium]